MKKYLDRGLMIIFFLIIVGALLASVYMLTTTLNVERTRLIQNYFWNEQWYTCVHTPGEMECWLAEDPNVGGGQLIP